MKLKISLFIILLHFTIANGQDILSKSYAQLDSMYFAFLRIKNLLGSVYDGYIKDKKCGFGLINSVKMNITLFPQEKRDIISSVLFRPITQKSLITPSGKFRVHFDTSGIHSIQYSIEELIKAIDSVYNFEVNLMGFPEPPGDFGSGGDDRYDIYIQNISPLYGYTEFEQPVGGNRYTSFIIIDNSFHEVDYYTKGIDAARVTIAHEYHHAIQIGNYIYRESDTFFYELTSTSMEEFVFDLVNDYYGYIRNFFANPTKLFSSYDGYSQAIWNIYLHKVFNDFSIFRDQWELMKNHRALDAIRLSIGDRGKSFRDVFSNFYLWNYYTGDRSDSTNYYEEGKYYPQINFSLISHFTGQSKIINGRSQPCSGHYFLIIDSLLKQPFSPDSLVLILVNTNIDSALQWNGSSQGYNYKITLVTQQSDQSYKKVTTNLYSKLEVDNPKNWVDRYIVNDTSKSVLTFEGKGYAFPMPVDFSKNNYVKIPVPNDWSGEIELKIFSAGLDLIFSNKRNVQVFEDKLTVLWDGRDNNNNKVSSGVYFYIAVMNNKQTIGKIVVIN